MAKKKKVLKDKPDGRPPAISELDLDKLKALMRLKPTLADTAAFFQCSERTVENTVRKHFDLTFFDFREQNAVHTRLSLIRKAIGLAEAGNVSMLVFSLKNMCKWTEKSEISTDEEKGFRILIEDYRGKK